LYHFRSTPASLNLFIIPPPPAAAAAMSGGVSSAAGPPKKCGLQELLIFIAAIVCGTACSICSKTMMELHGVGITGQVEQFSKPLFQTFGASFLLRTRSIIPFCPFATYCTHFITLPSFTIESNINDDHHYHHNRHVHWHVFWFGHALGSNLL